jgi:transposase-like protein
VLGHPFHVERSASGGWKAAAAQAIARAAGVCPRAVRKWVTRYKAEGLAGLADRSSRPRHLYRPVAPAIAEGVIALRRQRLTGKHIAKITAVSVATVGRVLKRAGLNQIKDLDPPAPVRRHGRQHSGELIHVDFKKLGRIERVWPSHRRPLQRPG